jgi:hypothetical protein
LDFAIWLQSWVTTFRSRRANQSSLTTNENGQGWCTRPAKAVFDLPSSQRTIYVNHASKTDEGQAIGGLFDSFLRSIRGNNAGDVAAKSVADDGSARSSPVTVTGEPCYTKKSLAAHLAISVRTLDRCAANGGVPIPDLLVGDSPRWAATTISRWLKTKPRLTGRRGGAA